MANSNNVTELLKNERITHIARWITLLRIAHIIWAPLAVVLAFSLLSVGFGPLFAPWEGKTLFAAFLLLNCSGILIYNSAKWLETRRKKGDWPETGLDWIVALSFRAGSLGTASLLGVIMAYFGVAWPVWLATIALAGVIFVRTYPSDRRLKECVLEGREKKKASGISSA